MKPDDKALRAAAKGAGAPVEWDDPPGLVPSRGNVRRGCSGYKCNAPVPVGVSRCAGCRLVAKEKQRQNAKKLGAPAAVIATRKRQAKAREDYANKRRSSGEFMA